MPRSPGEPTSPDPRALPSREAVTGLARRLNARIPHDAVVVRDGDLAAIAWNVHYPSHETSVAILSVEGGVARFDKAADIAPDAAGVTLAARAFHASGTAPVYITDILLVAVLSASCPPPEGIRGEVLEAVAAGLDAESLLLMDRRGLTHSVCFRWLTGAGQGRADAHAFAREHPWLLMAVGRYGIPVPPGDARRARIDAAARQAIRSMLKQAQDTPDEPPTDAEVQGLVDRMRWFQGDWQFRELHDPETPAALLRIPADRFPPALGPDDAPRGDAMQGHMAFNTLARNVTALAAIGGRPVASVLGRVPDWASYARSLGTRAKVVMVPDHNPNGWGGEIPRDAVSGVNDMARSFAREILAPAALIEGLAALSEAEIPPLGAPIIGAERDPLVVAALRILLGERTLGRLVELGGRWHSRSSRIAEALAVLAGPEAPAGPLLFEPREPVTGLRVRCLTTAAELVAEGSPGPDGTGAAGLSHCVGSYTEDVVAGRTAIVSLRRVHPDGTYERISTAEVDFRLLDGSGNPWVVQHKGFRNGHPGNRMHAVMLMALKSVAREASANLAAHVPEPYPHIARVIAASGSWDTVRDLWAFALPRPLRSAGPAVILAAAGLTVRDGNEGEGIACQGGR